MSRHWAANRYLEVNPDEPIVLRCKGCPGWSLKSTMGKRESDFENHLSGRLHLRKQERQRKRRLVADGSGGWLL